MIDIEMSEADRALVVENCRQASEKRIVITHGTDTMTDTAAAVAAAVQDKTVVLTGAMIPYAFGSSDGLFNLGSALSFVQVCPALLRASRRNTFSPGTAARIANGIRRGPGSRLATFGPRRSYTLPALRSLG